MFEHIRILSAIANLIVGTWIAFYAYQKYKTYTYSFLKSLVHLIVFNNLITLIMFIAKYFELNLMVHYSQNIITILKYAAILCIILSGYGMIISLLKIFFGFKDEEITLRYRIWIAAGFIVIILCLVVRILWPQRSASFTWLHIILGLAIANLITMDISIPLDIVKYTKKIQIKTRLKLPKVLDIYIYHAMVSY